MPVSNISEARKAAARANGAKSRGPVSQEGKARSSRNNLRHGLTMKAMVLPSEAPDAALAILKDYTAKFAPVDPVEDEMVEMLAHYQWQMLRAQNMHYGYLASAEAAAEDKLGDKYEAADPRTRAAEAFRYMVTEDNSFRLLLRYIGEIRRNYNTKLREIQSVQKNRLNQAEIQENEPEIEPEAGTEPNLESPSEPTAATDLPQTPRSAPCPCGSGAKFKRCCGWQAPPVLGKIA